MCLPDLPERDRERESVRGIEIEKETARDRLERDFLHSELQFAPYKIDVV